MEKLVKQITRKKRLKIPKKLPKNLVLKLVSLFFAVFLWYFVVGEDKVDITVYVPLEITNLPQNLVISNQFRKQLEVKINGPRGLVRSIANQDITRPVDLNNVQPGNHVIKNTPDSIKLPKGIQIQNIRPANITLTIDRLIEKELPIKPVLEGNPAAGYAVASVISDPPTLALTAPAAILDKDVFLPTKPIDLTDRKADFNIQTTLDLRDEVTELVGEPVISVTVQIGEKQTTREFDRIPVELKHEAERTIYRLNHNYVDVVTEIPYHLADKDPKQFKFSAILDAGNLPPGHHVVPVKIITGDQNLIIKKVVPETIEIDISPPQPNLKRIITSPPQPKGPNQP